MAALKKGACVEDGSGDTMLETKKEGEGDRGLHYQIDQSPPIHITILLSLQHVMICCTSSLTLVSIMGDVLCTGHGDILRSQLFSTALFMSGLSTITQTLFGSRLPVFQGPSFTFLSPLFALGTDPAWSCTQPSNITEFPMSHMNQTVPYKLTAHEKLQEMSGSLMAASSIEVLIGMFGLVGPLMTRVGPITVAPTITLIGLSLFHIPVDYSRPCPPMAAASALIMLVCSLYLSRVVLPIGCGKNSPKIPFFQIFPMLLAVAIVWIGAAALTAFGLIGGPGSMCYAGRTDLKTDVVQTTPWILATYPGQFGAPSWNTAAFVAFLAAVVSSIVESVGDYLAAAHACQVPAPPRHAVSRGILLEGLASVLSGGYGAGHATATYSGNIALLSLCRTASRSVLVIAGVVLMAVSFLGKVAAAMSLVPEPVLGGVYLIILGYLTAIGIATLRHVDLDSTRNLIIIGVSIFVGIAMKDWIYRFPDFINTGHSQTDQILRVILGTPMVLGGLIACFLDNTVPGTREERGLHQWAAARQQRPSDEEADDPEAAEAQRLEEKTYGWRGFPALRQRCKLLRSLPFLPPAPARLSAWGSTSGSSSGDSGETVEDVALGTIVSDVTSKTHLADKKVDKDAWRETWKETYARA